MSIAEPLPHFGRGAKLLSGTVGFRCDNLTADVETSQRLLNLNGSFFALGEPLACDGKIGEKTVTAIRQFQRELFGEVAPSGELRPGDRILLRLCSALPDTWDEFLLPFAYLNAADEAIRKLAKPIVETLQRYQINTPLRQAHFLAQIGHESGELRFRKELADGTAYENRRDLGNTQPGDGPRFKGRGLIQLTGRKNYAEYTRSNIFGINVEMNPELVATDDRLCVDVAGWYWDRRRINGLADRDDADAVTRAINGGLNGLADRQRLLSRAKVLMDI
jgi:putative chitinase